MKDGFVKTAAATPKLKVADPGYNAGEIVKLTEKAAAKGALVIVFPELCITGYSCGDLFLHQPLLDGALEALKTIRNRTSGLNIAAVVGLPLNVRGKLYNCAAVVCGGRIEGIVPKSHIPNYSEFYELRYFSPGTDAKPEIISCCGQSVPFGGCQVFRAGRLTLGIEICEDLWARTPPSVKLTAAGAKLILNLSASDELVGKADFRRELVKGQSARLTCGYVYADAGFGESTQDVVYAGHNLIAESGSLIAESQRFESGITYADIDLGRIEFDRRRINTLGSEPASFETEISLKPVYDNLRDRYFSKAPFVPDNPSKCRERCEEILHIQSAGLATRIAHTRSGCVVIGLSGGLDSTLALIVAVHAFDRLKLDRKGIVAVTMPCFGTTARTKGNAEMLAEAYGVTLETVDIKAAVDQHLSDINEDKEKLSVTYENAQARMRTMVLMDIANQRGGLVVGTGDLSELALGWATYNGDHMSMYGVNASVPKTLVRYLVNYESDHSEEKLKKVLRDILDTPVSPELLPPKDGDISQKTEDLVGPYELHDFFLYYFIRFGYSPKKIYRIALKAFKGAYDEGTIKRWLVTFTRRFFSQQFKRSCLPDGPKVGTVALSPRGDWRMPSDACAALWLEEAEKL